MQRYIIIVEGKADIIFIKDYLIFLDSSLHLKDDKRKKEQYISISSDSKIIKIFYSGGYTKIKPSKTRIEKLQMDDGVKEEYEILVIQDADDPTKNHGGVENRMNYLNEIDIEFKTFLFPNHKDNGDLETLLLQIINKEKYANFLDCYEKYVSCIKNTTKKEFIKELLEDKHKVFSYFSAYYGMGDSKEENREYSSEYWDLENDALEQLRSFIEDNIK